MKPKPLDTVTGRLEAIGCWPVPPFVVEELEANINQAVAEFRGKIIKKKVTFEAVTRAIKDVSTNKEKRVEFSGSPALPPTLPNAQ